MTNITLDQITAMVANATKGDKSLSTPAKQGEIIAAVIAKMADSERPISAIAKDMPADDGMTDAQRRMAHARSFRGKGSKTTTKTTTVKTNRTTPAVNVNDGDKTWRDYPASANQMRNHNRLLADDDQFTTLDEFRSWYPTKGEASDWYQQNKIAQS